MPTWTLNAKRYASVMSTFVNSHLPPCYLAPPNSDSDWLMIHLPQAFESPIMFETIFSKWPSRREYNQRNFAQARRKKRPVSAEFFGLSDLCAPVMVGGRCQAMLAIGPFLRKPVTAAQLHRHWKGITGTQAGSHDPDFMRYAATVCKLVPLEGHAYKAFYEFMELLAQLIAGEKAPEPLIRRMDHLRSNVLLPLQPYRCWVAAEDMTDRVRVAGYIIEQPSQEVRQELKLSRMPGTAMAIMPRDAGSLWRANPVEAMARASQFQKECVALCARLPETICGRLENYGAFFLTSGVPGRSPVQEKLEQRDFAKRLADLANQQLGVPVLVGVGASTSNTAQLFESLHQAVVALHLCLQRAQTLVFYEDQVPANTSTGRGLPLLPALSGNLVEAFQQGSDGDILLARDPYMRQVILESGDDLEVMRTHFLCMVYGLLNSVQKKSLVDPATYRELATRSCRRLQDSHSVGDLLEAFQRGLDPLQTVFMSPATGSRELRVVATRQFIFENLQRPLRLKEAATRAGLSPGYFSKAFKKHSGLNFEKYLLQQRLEKASRLLKSSQLPAYLVAQECGFGSAIHFSNAFKQAYGISPLRYRKTL